MHVFVTGASGYVGSAVVTELLRAGHTVTGLARSSSSADQIAALGAQVHLGDIRDPATFVSEGAKADAVIHLAFDHDSQHAGDLASAVATDIDVTRALGFTLAGSGKALVTTNATGALVLAGHDGLLSETDTREGGPRVDVENMVIGMADNGIRSAVVRLPPTVHGDGQFGFVTALLGLASVSGASAYVGDGGNRWPSVHVRDAAKLYRLAAESVPAGSRLHAVVKTGVSLNRIAHMVGERLSVPTMSVDRDQAAERFGPLTPFILMDNPASSKLTAAMLTWTPTEAGLLDGLATASLPATLSAGGR